MPDTTKLRLREIGERAPQAVELPATGAKVLSIISGVDRRISGLLENKKYEDIISFFASDLLHDPTTEQKSAIYAVFSSHISAYESKDLAGALHLLNLSFLLFALAGNCPWFRKHHLQEVLCKEIKDFSDEYFAASPTPSVTLEQVKELVSLAHTEDRYSRNHKDYRSGMDIHGYLHSILVNSTASFFEFGQMHLLSELLSQLKGMFAFKIAFGVILKTALANKNNPKVQELMQELLTTFDAKKDATEIISTLKNSVSRDSLIGAFDLSYWGATQETNLIAMSSHVAKNLMDVDAVKEEVKKGNFDALKKTIEGYRGNKLIDIEAVFYTIETATETYIEELTLEQDIDNLEPLLEFCDWCKKMYQYFPSEDRHSDLVCRLRHNLNTYSLGSKTSPNVTQKEFEWLFRVLKLASTSKYFKPITPQVQEKLSFKFQAIVLGYFKENAFSELYVFCKEIADMAYGSFLYDNFWYILSQIHRKYLELQREGDRRIFGSFCVWMEKLVQTAGVYPELYESFWAGHILEDTAKYSSGDFWKPAATSGAGAEVVFLK